MFDFGIFDDLGFDQEQADSTPVVIPHRIKSIAAALTLPRIRLSLSASNPVPIVEIRISGEAFPYLIPRIITDHPPPPPVVATTSSAPEWVPANAKIYIDLVNDRAWTEADGEVAIDTLLGANVDAGSTFDVADISSSGLASTSMPNFTDAAGVIDTAGRTFVFELVTHSSAGNFELDLTTDFATFDPDYYFLARTAPSSTSFISTSTPGDVDLTDAQLLLASAVNRVAFTVTPTHAAFSINGATVASKTVTASFAAISNAVIYGDYAFLRTIAVYPVQNDANLVTLTRIIPEGAKIHINLVQDWAWTEADGYVAINTLLGTDANTENGWNVTGYDPTFLTADGYLPSASPTAVALIGAARTELLAGSTMRLLTEDADGSSKLDFFVVSTDGQDAIYASIVATDWKSASYNGELNQIVSGSINHIVGAKNCFAITLTPTRLDTAVNGSSPETSVLTTSDYPEAGLNACGFDVESINTTALQSITIYDALPSTAGLSALSETGVENTAPHDIVWVWNDSAGIVDGVVPQSQVTDLGYTGGIDLGVAMATDDQGNPLIWSMPTSSPVEFLVFDTADGGATFAMYLKNINVEPLTIPVGSYSFTLRATDPGGLYVEQEFTITVTAGVPEWLPEGATTFADFVNGNYWDGSAEVADPSDMFQSDDTDGDPWTPENIVPGTGYNAPSGEAAGSYHGAALTAVGVEFVIVVELNVTDVSDGFHVIAYDGGFDNTFLDGATPAVIHDSNGSTVTARDLGAEILEGINRIAFRFSNNSLSVSVNGRTTVSAADPHTPTPISVITFYGHPGNITRSVTTYPNSTLDADLPALSRIIPENAKIYINLVQDWAWTEADGFVEIDTLLGTDANTNNYWGPSEYTGNILGAYGLVYDSNPPALIGAALTKVLAGATWRIVLTEGVGFGTLYVPVMSADGNDAILIQVTAADRGLDATSNSGPLSLSIDSIANKGSAGVKNVLAFTLTSTRLDLAMNGSDAVSGVIGSSDRPSGNPLIATLIDPSGTALSNITIYDALPSTAGLSALSETGVTNTAPSGLIANNWRIASQTSSTGISVTLPSSTFADNYTGSPYVTLFQFNASHNDFDFTDPDGNPLSEVSITSASDARIKLINSLTDEEIPGPLSVVLAGGAVVFLDNDPVIPNGTTFTLRATDPGGLYVEQEFTITVTA